MPVHLAIPTGFSETVAASQTIGSAGTTFSPNISGMSGVQNIVLQSAVTAISGTTPTLTVTLQDSVDGGTTWNDVQSAAQQTATGAVVVRINTPFSDLLRLKYVVGGTLPSVTFKCDWYCETSAPIPALGV